MKKICLLLLVCLFGCVNQATLEELEDEAIMTGDWSKVEARERLRRQNELSSGLECPDGLTKSCSEHGFKVRCGCVLPQTLPRIRRP